MKNQYVGDIGDYGKYSLLRAFTDAKVKVGVNWYLTENDKNKPGHGGLIDYLKEKNEQRYCLGSFFAINSYILYYL